MIYVDSVYNWYKGKARYHLLADSIEELHTFAAKIGINKCWYEKSNSGVPHYDITEVQRTAAIGNGAIELTRKGLGNLLKGFRNG